MNQLFGLFMSMVAKFARYTESAYFFTGASLGQSNPTWNPSIDNDGLLTLVLGLLQY